ncbi:MAG TPA: sigma-70 family RNA polymerase sigma factor [Spirochaetota bacterium]
MESPETREKIRRFTDTYNRLYSLLFSSVYSKVNNFDEAEDITQELFIRLFRKFDEVIEPRAWLYGALRIVLMDYYREKGKREEEIELLIDDARMSYVNGFREARMVIQAALTDPEVFAVDSDKVVFELVAIHNYSFVEVSKHLGLSYRQARYSFQTTARKIVELLKSRGIAKLEDLL